MALKEKEEDEENNSSLKRTPLQKLVFSFLCLLLWKDPNKNKFSFIVCVQQNRSANYLEWNLIFKFLFGNFLNREWLRFCVL